MLGYGTFLLGLIQFFHLTLGVPNPASGVLSPNPAATDDQYLEVKTTKPSIIPRETQSIAESTTPGATLQRRDDLYICYNEGRRAKYDDVVKAKEKILQTKDEYHYIFQQECKLVLNFPNVRINLCGGWKPPFYKTYWEISNIIDGFVAECTNPKTKKIGGIYTPIDKDFYMQILNK